MAPPAGPGVTVEEGGKGMELTPAEFDAAVFDPEDFQPVSGEPLSQKDILMIQQALEEEVQKILGTKADVGVLVIGPDGEQKIPGIKTGPVIHEILKGYEQATMTKGFDLAPGDVDSWTVPIPVPEPEEKPYFSSGKDDWGTEQALYDRLCQEFAFDLDVCASEQNAKCPVYLTEEMDALSIDWWGTVFMNPPFSKAKAFLAKMVKELMLGHIDTGVAVVAARTDTEAWHMASCYAGEVRYLKGRVSYEIYPTLKQRLICETLQGVHIDAQGWAILVKEVGLPKVALQRLIKDPAYQGPELSGTAPFPSAVLVFDRRPVTPSTVYWDWRKNLKTGYLYGNGKGGKAATVKGSPWLTMVSTPLMPSWFQKHVTEAKTPLLPGLYTKDKE